MNSVRIILLLPSIILALILSGCATAEYKAPLSMGLTEAQTTRIFDTDFESAWTAINACSSGFFFSIDKHEKDSGFVSVKFSGEPIRYVDGGSLARSGENNSQQYAAYMLRNNLKLSGEINLSIVEVTEGKTQVTVNAQYTVLLPGKQFINSFTGKVDTGSPTTWSFDSKSYDTQALSSSSDGTGNRSRTFSPTGALESDVLEELAVYLN